MDALFSVPRKKQILEKLDKTWNIDVLENIIEDVLKTVVKEGSLAIDGGANVGRHSLHMTHSVGSRGKLCAVEPLPVLHKRLQTQYSIYPQFKLFPNALFHSGGLEVEFSHVKERNTVSSIVMSAEYEKQYTVEKLKIVTITIDEIIANETLVCSAIKLDLEGAERDAMLGASQTLQKQRPVVVFEDGRWGSAKNFNYDLPNFYQWLNDLDYRIISIFGEEFTCFEHYAEYNPWYNVAIPAEKIDYKNCVLESFLKRINQYI